MYYLQDICEYNDEEMTHFYCYRYSIVKMDDYGKWKETYLHFGGYYVTQILISNANFRTIKPR